MMVSVGGSENWSNTDRGKSKKFVEKLELECERKWWLEGYSEVWNSWKNGRVITEMGKTVGGTGLRGNCPDDQFQRGGSLPHTQPSNFHGTKWVTYNLTELWHYLPRDSIIFHKLRAWFQKMAPPQSNFRCQLQVQVVPCASEQMTINQRFSWPPFSLEFN